MTCPFFRIMNDNFDTIAAIATPSGNSGIGIIRVSGKDAFIITDKFLRSASGLKLNITEMMTHTIHYGFVCDDDNFIDEVLIMVMRAPKTFTAENTVEINCHGGMFVLKRVLDIVIKNGARLAEPGEFSRRAFLNGRIDLSEAESIMDIISSENEFSRKNSMEQLRGAVYNKVMSIRETLLHEVAYIEAALDDPEHYDLTGYSDKLKAVIKEKYDGIKTIINSSSDARIYKNGINAVIVGKPNAGKSSLLNILAGYEKAIVTDIAGTTRDAVEERISFDGMILNIIDTAGIRETGDVVENIGIDRAKKYIEKADLILFVIDSSRELDRDDLEIISLIKDRPSIVLLNKCDMKPVITAERISSVIDKCVIEISALNDVGIDKLRDRIRDMFCSNMIKDNSQIFITNVRQLQCFSSAAESLRLVLASIDNGMSEDVFTIDIMDAYNELGKIIGQDTGDDLADKIFSEFCMGK